MTTSSFLGDLILTHLHIEGDKNHLQILSVNKNIFLQEHIHHTEELIYVLTKQKLHFSAFKLLEHTSS